MPSGSSNAGMPAWKNMLLGFQGVITGGQHNMQTSFEDISNSQTAIMKVLLDDLNLKDPRCLERVDLHHPDLMMALCDIVDVVIVRGSFSIFEYFTTAEEFQKLKSILNTVCSKLLQNQYLRQLDHPKIVISLRFAVVISAWLHLSKNPVEENGEAAEETAKLATICEKLINYSYSPSMESRCDAYLKTFDARQTTQSGIMLLKLVKQVLECAQNCQRIVFLHRTHHVDDNTTGILVGNHLIIGFLQTQIEGLMQPGMAKKMLFHFDTLDYQFKYLSLIRTKNIAIANPFNAEI